MIEITTKPLDADVITELVKSDTCGAVVTFLGTTRDNNLDRIVSYLEYEMYEPMAEKELNRIVDEIKEKWSVKIAIAHRIGRVNVGEISLVVAVSSPHREEAFEACSYSVGRIKETVPIWKKEYFEGGEVWIESPEDFAQKKAAEHL